MKSFSHLYLAVHVSEKTLRRTSAGGMSELLRCSDVRTGEVRPVYVAATETRSGVLAHAAKADGEQVCKTCDQ